MLKRSPGVLCVACVAITAATFFLWTKSATYAHVRGLNDFLTLRNKVLETVGEHLENLPEGVTMISSDRSSMSDIDPGDVLIKEAVARTGHWSYVHTKRYTLRIDRSQVPGKYLPDVSAFLMHHFTDGLLSTDVDTYRKRNSLDTKYRPEKIASGLTHGISGGGGGVNDENNTSYEEIWSSPQGVINIVFRVDINQRPGRDQAMAHFSWYRFERY